MSTEAMMPHLNWIVNFEIDFFNGEKHLKNA